VTIGFPAFRIGAFERFFLGHPVKPILVGLFFWSMTGLLCRGFRAVQELRRIDRTGCAVITGISSIAEVRKLVGPRGPLAGESDSRVVGRVLEAVGYSSQAAPSDLEQRLGSLADRDSRSVEANGEVFNSICRVIPALGVFGTLARVTALVSGHPESASDQPWTAVVPSAVAACDTTVIALLMWTLLALANATVVRLERSMLASVDGAVRTILGDCLVQPAASRAFLGVVDGVSRVILQATRDAWREQGQLWSRTVERAGEGQVAAMREVADQFAARMAQGISNQDLQFQQFLGGLETLRQLCQKSLADVASKMTAHQAATQRQVELLGTLVGEEGRMTSLQRSLNDNLNALANVQALDQAIHSVTAAVHLLTARSRSSAETRNARSDELKRGVAA
jgi:hypothetical protein